MEESVEEFVRRYWTKNMFATSFEVSETLSSGEARTEVVSVGGVRINGQRNLVDAC